MMDCAGYRRAMMADPHETDTVRRPLFISFIHPDPKEVLMVGMSGGAWSQLIANHPQVEKVTIVDNNNHTMEMARTIWKG